MVGTFGPYLTLNLPSSNTEEQNTQKQKVGKTSIFTHLQLHQKQTTKPLKPQNVKTNTTQPTTINQTTNKTPKQKTPFCHVKGQPLFFIYFLFAATAVSLLKTL